MGEYPDLWVLFTASGGIAMTSSGVPFPFVVPHGEAVPSSAVEVQDLFYPESAPHRAERYIRAS